MNVKNRLFVLTMVMVCAVCGFMIRGAKAQAPSAPGPKKAEEQFKNIQTLKGIPADQLIPTMQFITASLGVECDFCHVQGAMEKDDKKPKQTARKMMEMMFAINKDSFEGHREVTCYSCHRGSTDPVSTPLVASEDMKEAPPERRSPKARGKRQRDRAPISCSTSTYKPWAGRLPSKKSRAARRRGQSILAGSRFPSICIRKIPTSASRFHTCPTETA